jgi:hypothetical protein
LAIEEKVKPVVSHTRRPAAERGAEAHARARAGLEEEVAEDRAFQHPRHLLAARDGLHRFGHAQHVFGEARDRRRPRRAGAACRAREGARAGRGGSPRLRVAPAQRGDHAAPRLGIARRSREASGSSHVSRRAAMTPRRSRKALRVSRALHRLAEELLLDGMGIAYIRNAQDYAIATATLKSTRSV